MKFVSVVSVVVLIAGCASSAAPNYFNGNYYLAGDRDCVRVEQLSSTRVMCMDKKGNFTGNRDAMTPQQIQMYQMQALHQQMQLQQLTQQLQQTGQAFQNSAQQTLQQSQQYTAPQANVAAPYGSSSSTTYRRVGSTIIGSDGTTCQVVGESVICN